MRAQEFSAWYLPVADVQCLRERCTQRLNFKSPKIQQIINAEDAEDFAKARRGLRGKSFIMGIRSIRRAGVREYGAK